MKLGKALEKLFWHLDTLIDLSVAVRGLTTSLGPREAMNEPDYGTLSYRDDSAQVQRLIADIFTALNPKEAAEIARQHEVLAFLTSQAYALDSALREFFRPVETAEPETLDYRVLAQSARWLSLEVASSAFYCKLLSLSESVSAESGRGNALNIAKRLEDCQGGLATVAAFFTDYTIDGDKAILDAACLFELLKRIEKLENIRTDPELWEWSIPQIADHLHCSPDTAMRVVKKLIERNKIPTHLHAEFGIGMRSDSHRKQIRLSQEGMRLVKEAYLASLKFRKHQ